MNARTPRPAVEEPTEESDSEDSSDDDDGQDDDGDNMEQEQPPDPYIGHQPMHNHDVHPNTIILPVETRPIEELRQKTIISRAEKTSESHTKRRVRLCGKRTAS
jgi:hypothetical protein